MFTTFLVETNIKYSRCHNEIKYSVYIIERNIIKDFFRVFFNETETCRQTNCEILDLYP